MFLALLQDAAGAAQTVDVTMIAVLAVLALFALAVLGLKFLRNLFEVVTAPTASLKYHGQSDHFFYSLMVVFLGGLLCAVILIANQPKLVSAFGNYSSAVSHDLAAGNGNANYRAVAEDWSLKAINDNFDIYVVRNLLFMPMAILVLWLALGFFTFLFARMFGGSVTAVDMLGTTAYSTLFMAIGFGLVAVTAMNIVASSVGGTGASPDAMGIAGAVLFLWGLILYLIGVTQAADLTTGHTIGVVIAMVIILGGSYFGINYQGAKKFDEFRAKIQGFNPATQTL